MKLEDKVYIPKVKKNGVIKEFLPNGRAKATYFDYKDKRQVIEVGIEDIEPVKQDNKYYYAVRAFHKAFNNPVGNRPQRISEERKKARLAWMREELQEYEDAQTLKDEVDAMIDEIYFCIGTLVEMGVKPDRIFDAVQASNMGKLWNDGKPRFRESDGKIIKPPTWKSPDEAIEAEIARQLQG